ncbi:hypothetical protein HMPREF1705_04681 [Acetomicrobium hydrogeniformans ATCC BAA-1850]|uniref:Uncharacterized protein n=1 Tax=Acetomicrobium hydrogeniformans ATCC BAA-1850 TaxID=592015 RepID=A0A0T5XC80_9BACT|nr:hypothetical protein HMPREF1705_04681 [Acetomicrobium hydrogeniformans ATCC BAA-1850]
MHLTERPVAGYKNLHPYFNARLGPGALLCRHRGPLFLITGGGIDA